MRKRTTAVANDMGSDGKANMPNQYVARDATGFNLNYFTGDYLPVNILVNPFPGHSAYMPLPAINNRPLYNGNISSSSTAVNDYSYYPMDISDSQLADLDIDGQFPNAYPNCVISLALK